MTAAEARQITKGHPEEFDHDQYNHIITYVKQLALNGLTTYEYDYPITNGVRKKLIEDGYNLNDTILEGTTIIGW
jgi:hypothetical protein